MYQKIKRRAYELLVEAPEGDWVATAITLFIMLLIAVNVAVSIAETEPALAAAHPTFFYNFEFFSVVVFTIEYVVRIWAITLDPAYSHPIKGRIKLALSPMAIVDFLAIAPFYMQVFIPGLDLRFVRALRLFRLFRVFKFGRYTESLGLLKAVIGRRREELIMSVVIFFITVILAASIMYLFEHDAQPEKYRSVPVAMWWAIITLTTVGYGDVSPITSTGQVFGGIIAFLGICIFALPIGLLGSAFVEEINERKLVRQLIRKGFTNDEAQMIMKYGKADLLVDNTVFKCPHCDGPIPNMTHINADEQHGDGDGDGDKNTS